MYYFRAVGVVVVCPCTEEKKRAPQPNHVNPSDDDRPASSRSRPQLLQLQLLVLYLPKTPPNYQSASFRFIALGKALLAPAVLSYCNQQQQESLLWFQEKKRTCFAFGAVLGTKLLGTRTIASSLTAAAASAE